MGAPPYCDTTQYLYVVVLTILQQVLRLTLLYVADVPSPQCSLATILLCKLSLS